MIGSSYPSALCWMIATTPSRITNKPGLASPVAISRSPAA
jgi:hypothetical protein